MRILVLGAGVVGVTTAWQLLKDGHEVEVVDREEGPARFTSFANAGLIAPGHAYPWSSPAAPGIMLRSLLRGDQAIRFRPRLSVRQWAWVLKFLRECTAERTKANVGPKVRLCLYSQQVLHEVVAETGVEYDRRTGGLIYFYRDRAAFEAAHAKADMLRAFGLTIEALDAAATVEKDPGLAGAADAIAGALYVPTDESGDAHLFTAGLARVCEEKGARFHWGTEVTGLRTRGREVTAAITSRGDMTADAYVVCLGVMSPFLLEPLGIRIPIYPVKGYSATLPITDAERAPRIGGVDEQNLLAYCPMGARLRLTATAEIGGYSTRVRPRDVRVMLTRGRELFGAVADFSAPKLWAGLRPMTPTGIPVIDRAPCGRLWLNVGHGHMGWTMSNGSARILADLIAGREPAIEREGYRYAG